jgi:hypothetical protein
MIEYFNIEVTPQGYTLRNSNFTFVFNRSKYNNWQYYLKKVEPTQEHISGMFRVKKLNRFTGKTMEGKRVELVLMETQAIIKIQ